MFRNIIFQGQGIRSFASIGGLEKFEEYGILCDSVCGVSGGSIVAALYASGYTSSEMKKIFADTNICEMIGLSDDLQQVIVQHSRKKITDYFLRRCNLVQLFNFIRLDGLLDAKKVNQWLTPLLENKGISRFGDLQQVDLNIVAADVTNKEYIYFNKQNYRSTRIAFAIECSISIPIVFIPRLVESNKIVDGGILTRLPIDLFDSSIENTIAFMFQDDEIDDSNSNYWSDIVKTMLKAHDKKNTDKLEFSNQILVSTGEISSVQFNLTPHEKENLLACGTEAVETFFKEKDLLRYLDLLSFLRDERWLDANNETVSILLSACNKDLNSQWFDINDIRRIKNSFPTLLNTVDRLWMNYSSGKFGFKIQKDIWQNSGQPNKMPRNPIDPLEYNHYLRKWNDFANRIGWRDRDVPFFSLKKSEKVHREIENSINLEGIPKGYLPNLLLSWFELNPLNMYNSFTNLLNEFIKKDKLFLTEIYDSID